MAANFPTQARVVIIGGGIMGCSTAYHLAKLGWKDVVLLEQGRLSGGTTWHAAGLVGQLRSYQNLTRLIRYSTELYSKLEAETGLATGWKQCGSLSVARTEERMVLLRRVGRHGQRPGRRLRAADAQAGRREVSHHAHRRPGRRGVAAGRRQGQSRRHHPGAGPRRAHRRRAHLREDARDGDRHQGRPCHRRADDRGPDQGRDRRQLRRPVGAPARAHGRRHGAALFLRAHVHRHREDGERAARPAGDARSRRLHLLQGGGRRPA